MSFYSLIALSDSLTIPVLSPPAVDYPQAGLSSKQPQRGGILYVCIYSLSDPRTGDVRYIGKTSDMRRRMRAHNTRSCNAGMRFWISELKENGLHPVSGVIETCKKEDWRTREQFWISEFEKKGMKLLNLVSGGNGCGDFSVLQREAHATAMQKLAQSSQWKENHLAAMKKMHRRSDWQNAVRKAAGIRCSSSGWRSANKARLRKRSLNPEWRMANAQMLKTIRARPEYRANHSAAMKRTWKPVFQIQTTTKDLVARFTSTKEAARLTGINRSNITRALSGGRPTAGGFEWQFA